jgi:hypothetical protein
VSDQNSETQHDADDVPVWTVRKLAKIANRTERQMFNLLENGHIKGARKVGGRWCGTPRAIRANFA